MSSQFKGVSYRKATNDWRAIYKQQIIGCFATEEAAAQAYDDCVAAVRGVMYPTAAAAVVGRCRLTL